MSTQQLESLEPRTAEDWRRLAGTRQGVINKLDKKVKRLEALVELLTESNS